jgi:hypothetical protein
MPINLRVLLVVTLVVAACSTRNTERRSEALASPIQQAIAEPSRQSSIRRIDFANFTYTRKPVYIHGPETFTLQKGEYEGGEERDPVGLASLAYGDATGDGSEEALVVLNMSVKGTAIPYFVYIYTLDNQKPKLLWAFAAGDRADGGLRQVAAAGGELIIELYGIGKTIGKDLYAEDDMTGGDCCPTHFTRAKYHWSGNTFMQKGPEEVFPKPPGPSMTMPEYNAPQH